MNIYEAVGMIWIILTSALSTVGIFYLAWLGAKLYNKLNRAKLDSLFQEVAYHDNQHARRAKSISR